MKSRTTKHNNMITYKTLVYLDGKRVGEIAHISPNEFQYFPYGSKSGGEVFETLEACKQSIESH